MKFSRFNIYIGNTQEWVYFVMRYWLNTEQLHYDKYVHNDVVTVIFVQL